MVMGLGRFGGGLDSVIFAARLGREVIVTDLSGEAELSAPMKALPATIESLKMSPESFQTLPSSRLAPA